MNYKSIQKVSVLTVVIFILYSFVFIGVTSAAALSSEQWNETFGGTSSDYSGNVTQTSDGGYIITGTTSSYGSGSADIWLIKTDANGNEQWNETFGGTSSDYSGNVEQTLDGGYIITGTTYSYGSGSADIWLIKTDANGNEQWNETFGGTSSDYSGNVEQTSDGGYIISGRTSSYGAGGYDLWIIKTDANGNEQWNETFGGTSWDSSGTVEQTSDGGYVITGTTSSYGAGNDDIWVIKTDANGNEQWNETFGGTNYESGGNVEQTSDGGYIITGTTSSYGAGNADIWLIKTDANGNEQWNETFGGTSWDSSGNVEPTSDGGYIISGETSSYGAGNADIWLIKTDANGNEQWNETFGGTSWESGENVEQTSDGGYIISGTTNSYGAGGSDIWVIKLSSETPPSSVGYSATVATGQNTYVQSSNGNFGLLLKGQTKTLNDSVILNNTGDISAKVEARFNDSISGVFGLISGTNLLNATNFALGQSGSLVSLDNNGTDVQIATASQGVTALDARLGVPSDAVAGDYSGMVVLTFSNDV